MYEYVKEFDELWKEFKEEITPEEAKEETKKSKWMNEWRVYNEYPCFVIVDYYDILLY